MSEDEEERNIKIILLGETSVGKTAIINRYINNEFNEESRSTFGASFATKAVKIDKIKYLLNVWDTSGQEKYHSLNNLFINGSDIVILVYSIISKISFEGLDYWYKTIKEKLEDDKYILAIIGNKGDLVENEIIPEEKAKEFAEEKNAIFKIVSAKEDPGGINALFNHLLNEFIKNKKYEIRAESVIIQRPIKAKKEKRGFC